MALPSEPLSGRAHPEGSDRYRWWVLVVVLAGLFSSNVLFTVFVVALPRVADGLRTSVSTATWVVTAPMLAAAVFVPLCGKLSDRYGHRRLFLLGMLGNVAVAMLSALSPDIGVLIFARALGGVVGAGLTASSMALVLGLFEKGERVKAMGWWSLVGAGGPVIGVAAGGVLISWIGWRSLFFLEMVLGFVALVLAMAILPRPSAVREPARRTKLDWPGACLVVTAVGSLLFGLNRGPLLGWGSSLVIGAFALSALLALLLVVAELRAGDPLVPLHYLRKGGFSFPIVAQSLSNFSYMGGFFLSPLLLEQVYGHGESAAGLLVIPRPLSFSLIAPVAGYVAVKVGERTAAVTGTLAVFVSMVVFALSAYGTGVALVEVALILSGIGMGIASPSITASMSNVVEHESLGTASATQQLMVQIATVAGIQVMQTVQESASAASATSAGAGAALLPSFHAAFTVGAVVALAGVAFATRVRSTESGRAGQGELALAALGADLAEEPAPA